jgi:hypothetical protein
VQHEATAPEHRLEKSCKLRCDFAELRKDENLLLARGYDFDDFAKTRKLAAVALGPFVVAEPL